MTSRISKKKPNPKKKDLSNDDEVVVETRENVEPKEGVKLKVVEVSKEARELVKVPG